MTNKTNKITRQTFWELMKDYDSRYCRYMCKNINHGYSCEDCIGWSYTSTEWKTLKGYKFANFRFLAKGKDLTICARQKIMHGSKIDMFIAVQSRLPETVSMCRIKKLFSNGMRDGSRVQTIRNHP